MHFVLYLMSIACVSNGFTAVSDQLSEILQIQQLQVL